MGRLFRRLPAACVVGLLCTAPQPTFADPVGAEATSPSAEQRARTFFRRGQASYRLGAYDAAIALFQAGYDADPLPLFLYNIGSSARRAGHLEEARDYFQRYLAVAPHAPERREINGWLKDIDRALKVAGESPLPARPIAVAPPPVASPADVLPVAPMPPPPAVVAPVAEVSAVRAPHRNRALTITGFSMLAVGLGVVAAGGGLDAGAAHANDEIAHPTPGWVFEESVQTRRDRYAAAAIGLYIGGGVLAATGLGLGLFGLRRR